MELLLLDVLSRLVCLRLVLSQFFTVTLLRSVRIIFESSRPFGAPYCT
jgi:hypothetical protein